MKRLLLALAILVFAAGCASTNPPKTPVPTPPAKKPVAGGTGASAQGYVVPAMHSDLSFRISGRVVQILVKEGDQVKSGQPLVKLQDADLKASLMQAQADLAKLQAGARPQELAEAQANLQAANGQVAAAQAALNKTQSGSYQADMAKAQADLLNAQTQYNQVKDNYDAIKSGHDTCKEYGVQCGGLGLQEQQVLVQLQAAQAGLEAAQANVARVQSGSNADVGDARARLDMAIARRDAAQARLNLVKAGATAEQIEIAKAQVARAQAALDEATLVAPFDGVVAQVVVNLGENVTPASSIVSLADTAHWRVDTDDLSEVDIVNVKLGAPATITVDALPGVRLNGKVKAITPRSAVKRGDVTYTVKVEILDPDPQLKWGMTSFVDIRPQ